MNTQVLHFVNPVSEGASTRYEIAEKLHKNDLEQIADSFRRTPIIIMVEVPEENYYQRFMPNFIVIDLEGTDKIVLSVEDEGAVTLYSFRVTDNGDLAIYKKSRTPSS